LRISCLIGKESVLFFGEGIEIAEALKNKLPIEVTLRNYRKDGALFYNRLKITPLFDRKGQLIYFLGVQYDITHNVNARKEIDALSNMLNTLSNSST
jgi:PAS domain-containing protein